MKRELIVSYTKKDFKVDVFCTGGPGGQNQNRNKNGVRITHIPSWLSSESRVYKSQGQNKSAAFHKLAEMIKKWHQDKLRSEKVEISKETIRTYHEQDNRVKDHISGFTQPYTEVFNDISKMVEARHKKLQEEK